MAHVRIAIYSFCRMKFDDGLVSSMENKIQVLDSFETLHFLLVFHDTVVFVVHSVLLELFRTTKYVVRPIT